MPRPLHSQQSFADLELEAQVRLDETLQQISDFLDQNASLVAMVREDLIRTLKNPRSGRDGMSPEQVLRSFLVKSVKAWDLRELRERIADGLSLRLFAHFFAQPVPKHDAFGRAFNRLTPETIRALNEVVVSSAVREGLENPKQLRSDTTVVETNVHYPTDSTLLWDGVRVINRVTLRLKKLVPNVAAGFRNRTRAARKCMQQIQRLTPKQRIDRNKQLYRRLIGVTTAVVQSARAVCEAARTMSTLDIVVAAERDTLVAEILRYCSLADRVVDQARRRVLQGEDVPNADKIFSIFEPHTDLIMRGKARKPVEFGHKVLLTESAAGLITDYKVLDGNPSDEGNVISSLAQHKKSFGAPPDLFATDRGFFSQRNVEACREAGVTTECIPQRGGQKAPEREAYEKSAPFKKGQRFRAGIEGRISVLMRGRGMRRCLSKGRQRFEVFIGLAVLANNLLAIAKLSSAKRQRREASARAA